MDNLTHVPSEEWNLRTRDWFSINAQFTEDWETYLLVSEHPLRIFSHPLASKITSWTRAEFPSVLLAHTYSLSQTLNRLACRLL